VSAAAADTAAGLAPVAPEVLSLTHEVVHAMTLVKWKLLSAVAVAVALTGGGFGFYAASADDKKPVGQKPVAGAKPAKPAPDGQKPKPGDKPDKPAPDAQKPKPEKPDKPKPDTGAKKPAPRIVAQIVGVSPADRTITVLRKRDSGPVEEFVQLAADAKVFVDGKPAALKAVPKDAIASFVVGKAKEGEPVEITELRVTGQSVTGLLTAADATTVTLDVGSKDGTPALKVFELAPGARVSIGGKDVKTTELEVGDKVTVVLTADGSAALSVTTGNKSDKPKGDKPEKPDRGDKFEKPKGAGDKPEKVPGDKGTPDKSGPVKKT
jgi:hypothetical protein